MKSPNFVLSSTRLGAVIATALFTCASASATEWNESIEDLLRSHPAYFSTVMENPEKFRIQIVYSQINRDENNRPSFNTFTYRLDDKEYFYPASTVKLPTAALALEKLKHLNIAGLDRNTTMLTATSADYQSAARTDSSAADGLPTVANYIRKILLVSDNDAFNRLYEFVGQQTINDSMHQMGYLQTRIVHRLEVSLSKDQNRLTNPIEFVAGDELIYRQDEQRAQNDFYPGQAEWLGVAEMINGVRVDQPKDFSEKNAYPLMDQHEVVKSLMFPDDVPATKRFDMSNEDYQFMHRYMSMYPGESQIAAYQNSADYPPGYVKFLLYGGDANQIPANIRIFNKSGDAYGFLTDSAYIIDFENNVEFLLSATIFTNENLIFNDDNYEYDEIGLPFLKKLGELIYNVEINRERRFAPDLTELRQIKY